MRGISRAATATSSASLDPAAPSTYHPALDGLRGLAVVAVLLYHGGIGWASGGYVSNWRLIVQDRGYFDTFATPSPLTHTWSLAVEEQWYLLWPLALRMLLGASARSARRSMPLVVITGAALASAAWAAALAVPGADPSRVYYGTDTRAQELLVGAALAVLGARTGGLSVPTRWRPMIDVAGGVSLLWVLWLAATVDSSTTRFYEGGMLVLAMAVGLISLAGIQPEGAVRRILGQPQLRAIGLISYGLYLWHFPLYVLLSSSRTGLSGTALLTVRLAASLLVALVSYRCSSARYDRAGSPYLESSSSRAWGPCCPWASHRWGRSRRNRAPRRTAGWLRPTTAWGWQHRLTSSPTTPTRTRPPPW